MVRPFHEADGPTMGSIMSFTFKLARRLAQVHIAGLTLVLASCSDVADPSQIQPATEVAQSTAVLSSSGSASLNTNYANQPPGLSLVTDRAYDLVKELGWLMNATPNFSILNDNSAPQSPSHVGRVTFPAGFQGGGAPLMAWYDIPGNKTKIYVSFWVRFSANWVGHSSGVNKIFFFQINRGNKVYLTAQGTGASSLQPQIRVQQINENPVTRNLLPNLSTGKRIVRGQWAHWELILKSNTNGQPNGTADWWVDGTKVGSYSNINFVPATAPNVWEKIKLNPTWGGTGGKVPADQQMDVDHTYVSGI